MEMNFPKIEPIALRSEGRVVIATIQRPEAMNALNASVVRGLSDLIDWLEAKTENLELGPRALILTGAGEKAFVAGADIKEFENLDQKAAAEYAARGQEMSQRLERLKIPVIAAVNGFALGGGLELALACDFIVASDNAKFGLPECTLGLMPGFGGTVRLPRRVGVARAREMTFTGNMIPAGEALILGLAVKVVSQADLIKTCLELANVIATRAPLAVAMIKKSIHEGASLSETEACRLEARLFGALFGTEDKAEGVRAFVEKRKASFKGR